ncbi:MAG: LamG domain-containing protein [Bacteroidales bacterium]|nr:LamG domain-containing protein [Bacteroidales bacterium]
MSRRHKYIVSSPPGVLPKFWFPLTSDAVDVMGNFPEWSTVSGVTYSSAGGYFTGSSRILKSGLSIPNSDIKTWGSEIMLPTLYGSGIYTIMKTFYKTRTDNQISYAPGWSQDINCAPYYQGSYSALSIASVPLVANRYYKLFVRQRHTDGYTDLFIDGVLRSAGNIVIPENQTLTSLSIGYNESNSGRGFKGYIRNVMLFDAELTDAQIAQL